jgi:hypothetical protein
MRARVFSVLLFACAGLILSCDDASPDEDTEGEESSDGAYLPFSEGDTWTYRVTNNGVVSTKVVTVHAQEKVGGTGPHKDDLAFRVTTSKGDADETVSWQAADGDRVLRYREQSFHQSTGELEQDEHWDPYKLHFDGSEERTADGAKWVEEYEETKTAPGKAPEVSTERDAWMVDSHGEKVTVPAGTFDAVVVQKAGGSDIKTYWYVRGVGKVKETGGQTEELVSYEVAR